MSSNNYADYIGIFEKGWKRPEGPPRVWCVHEGRKKKEDGRVPRYSIEELPKGMEEEVVDFMEKYFITEEPTSSCQNFASDRDASKELRTLWRRTIDQGISIVALELDSDPNVKPTLVGVNVLYVDTKDDEEGELKLRSKKFQRIWDVIGILMHEGNVYESFGVDKYLGAFSLSVHPSCRGQGLGEALLRTRDEIGKAYDIPVSATVFTAVASQILAARVGFTDSVVKKYAEITDMDGKLAFPGINVELIKMMVKRLG